MNASNETGDIANRRKELRQETQNQILREFFDVRESSDFVEEHEEVRRTTTASVVQAIEEESRHMGHLPLPGQRTSIRRALEGKHHRPLRYKTRYQVIEKPATVVEQIPKYKIPKAQLLVLLNVDSASFFSPEKQEQILEQGKASLELFPKIKKNAGDTIKNGNIGIEVYFKIKTLAGTVIRPLRTTPQSNFLSTDEDILEAQAEFSSQFHQAQADVMRPVKEEELPTIQSQDFFGEIPSDDNIAWLTEQFLFTHERENGEIFAYFPATVVADFSTIGGNYTLLRGKMFSLPEQHPSQPTQGSGRFTKEYLQMVRKDIKGTQRNQDFIL